MGDLIVIVLECKNKELLDKITDTLYSNYGITHVSKNILSGMYTAHNGEIRFNEYLDKLNSINHKILVIDTEERYTQDYLDIFASTNCKNYLIDAKNKLFSDLIEEIELCLL